MIFLYINKSAIEKILSKIEKTIKSFSILNKTFFKNNILRAHIKKILYSLMSLAYTEACTENIA